MIRLMPPVPLALAILLAACAPATPEAAPEPRAPAPVAAPQTSIAGRWRLVELDGKTGTPGFGIDLMADAGRIWWEPACAGQSARYMASGTSFRQLPPIDAEPRAVCDIGFPRELLDMWDVVAAADRVDRAPEGTLRLSGGGRSLVLRRLPDLPRQPDAPSSADLNAPVASPSQMSSAHSVSLAGHYRVAGIDGGELGGRRGLALEIGRDRIEFDNCQQIAWHYRHRDGRLMTERTPAITIDIAPKPTPCAAPLSEPEARMVAAIDAADTATLTASNGILLSGGGRSVLLFSQ